MVCGLRPFLEQVEQKHGTPFGQVTASKFGPDGSVPCLFDGAKSRADGYAERVSRYAGLAVQLAAHRSRGRRSQLTSRLEVEMAKTYLKGQAAQARAYSQAVVSEGGKVVWLAGQVAAGDASGKSLAGDFDGQVRELFSRLAKTLGDAGGALGEMVTMTVFITDARFGDREPVMKTDIVTIYP